MRELRHREVKELGTLSACHLRARGQDSQVEQVQEERRDWEAAPGEGRSRWDLNSAFFTRPHGHLARRPLPPTYLPRLVHPRSCSIAACRAGGPRGETETAVGPSPGPETPRTKSAQTSEPARAPLPTVFSKPALSEDAVSSPVGSHIFLKIQVLSFLRRFQRAQDLGGKCSRQHLPDF